MCTNFTRELQLTDGLLTDKLTKKIQKPALIELSKCRTRD